MIKTGVLSDEEFYNAMTENDWNTWSWLEFKIHNLNAEIIDCCYIAEQIRCIFRNMNHDDYG